MISPLHLKIPPHAAFRDALPSDAPPAGYPSRLPFVANRAVSFAESAEIACCSWPALAAGESPDATASLEDLFDDALAAAEQSGWILAVTAAQPFPPGWRHATLTRPGELLQLLAMSAPSTPAVTAWSYADSERPECQPAA